MNNRGNGNSRECACGLLKMVLLVLVLVAAPVLAAEPGKLTSFEQLLQEAGLEFNQPDGFLILKPQNNPLLAYEHVLRHKGSHLEIRYAIRPLARVQIDYEDPHSAAPEPNHLFPLLFNSITNRLSAGGHNPSREYPAKQARKLFGADWASASVMDIHPEFTEPFNQGLVIALHKNGKADAYVVFLYNDYAQVKKLVNDSLSALSFMRE